jgi:hypothetical protein
VHGVQPPRLRHLRIRNINSPFFKQNDPKAVLPNLNLLQIISNALFSFQFFGILGIFLSALTYFSLSLLIHQKLQLSDLNFAKKVFHFNIIIGIINVLSQLLLVLVPSQLSQIKMNQLCNCINLENEENLAVHAYLISGFAFNLFNYYLLNVQNQRMQQNQMLFVALKSIIILLQGIFTLACNLSRLFE